MEITEQATASMPPQNHVPQTMTVEEEPAKGEDCTVETPVTFDTLMSKPKRVVVQKVSVPDAQGNPHQVKVKFEAITSGAYDDLVAAHPPSREDKERGGNWNSKTFPPALVAKTIVQPKLTYEQAYELSVAPNWASGEFMDLFLAANKATMAGFEVPFSDNG